MTISCDVYVNGRRHSEPFRLADAVPAVATDGGFIGVDLHRPSPYELAEVTFQLGLPTLAVRDSAKTHTRPKLEVHNDTVVIVLKTIHYMDPEKIAVSEELTPTSTPSRPKYSRRGETTMLNTSTE